MKHDDEAELMKGRSEYRCFDSALSLASGFEATAEATAEVTLKCQL